MMYRLKWQTKGPVGWNRVHQVIGDINAVHYLYTNIVSNTRDGGRGVNAEIRSMTTGDDDGSIIYQWGSSDWVTPGEEPSAGPGDSEPL